MRQLLARMKNTQAPDGCVPGMAVLAQITTKKTITTR